MILSNGIGNYQMVELEKILNRAEEFHGHLGPFLVLGVRMGLIGLRELEVKRDEKKIRITAMLTYSIPFSCVIDGIQVATKCTVGNKKLVLKDSPGIAANFKLQNNNEITVIVNSIIFDRLKNELVSKKVPTERIRELAQLVASLQEDTLFTIQRK